MIEMFKKYLKEVKNEDLIYSDKGFATYILGDQECYIVDIHVNEEFRKKGQASKMADQIYQIAKQKGCKILTGTVYFKANNPTLSARALLGYGMQIVSGDSEKIIFAKEIN